MPELYDRILDAVKAKLDTAGLGVSVNRQRFPEFGNQATNVVVVSYFAEVETVGEGDWVGDWVGIPVLVQYFAPTLLQSSDDAIQEVELTARGKIYDALAYKRLAGVPEVTTLVPEPRAVAEPDNPASTRQPQASPILVRSGMLFRAMARRARAA